MTNVSLSCYWWNSNDIKGWAPGSFTGHLGFPSTISSMQISTFPFKHWSFTGSENPKTGVGEGVVELTAVHIKILVGITVMVTLNNTKSHFNLEELVWTVLISQTASCSFISHNTVYNGSCSAAWQLLNSWELLLPGAHLPNKSQDNFFFTFLALHLILLLNPIIKRRI